VSVVVLQFCASSLILAMVGAPQQAQQGLPKAPSAWLKLGPEGGTGNGWGEVSVDEHSGV
jgi:hypothetical protein